VITIVLTKKIGGNFKQAGKKLTEKLLPSYRRVTILGFPVYTVAGLFRTYNFWTGNEFINALRFLILLQSGLVGDGCEILKISRDYRHNEYWRVAPQKFPLLVINPQRYLQKHLTIPSVNLFEEDYVFCLLSNCF